MVSTLQVVESWMNRLGASEGDTELEQVRLCTKIGMECMELDPKKRPVARHIIDMLDKTGSAEYSDETDSSSVQQVGLLNVLQITSCWTPLCT